MAKDSVKFSPVQGLNHCHNKSTDPDLQFKKGRNKIRTDKIGQINDVMPTCIIPGSGDVQADGGEPRAAPRLLPRHPARRQGEPSQV